MQCGIMHVSFNQDSTCLSLATTEGFKIYNCETHKCVYEDPIGAVSSAEMLFCTSLVALVGAGEQAQLSPRRLSIINSCTKETISNLNFVSAVLSIRLNRTRLVVVLERKVHLHELNTLEVMHTIDTAHNPRGMCALSPSSEHNYLVVPAASTAGSLLVFDCNNLHVLCEINAHQNPVVAIAISFDGTLLASASQNGTLIRVHSLPSASKTFTFRRGVSPAHVYSLAFGPAGCSPPLLAASSDKGTIHVFRLSHQAAPMGVVQTATSFAGGLLSRVMPSYLGLDDMVEPARSVVSVKLPAPGLPSIVALATEGARGESVVAGTMARQLEEEAASRGGAGGAAAAAKAPPVPDRVRLLAVTADGLLHDWSLSGLVSGAGAQVAWSLEKEVPLQEHASEAIGAVVHAAEASPFGRAAGEGSSGGGGGGGGSSSGSGSIQGAWSSEGAPPYRGWAGGEAAAPEAGDGGLGEYNPDDGGGGDIISGAVGDDEEGAGVILGGATDPLPGTAPCPAAPALPEPGPDAFVPDDEGVAGGGGEVEQVEADLAALGIVLPPAPPASGAGVAGHDADACDHATHEGSPEPDASVDEAGGAGGDGGGVGGGSSGLEADGLDGGEPASRGGGSLKESIADIDVDAPDE